MREAVTLRGEWERRMQDVQKLAVVFAAKGLPLKLPAEIVTTFVRQLVFFSRFKADDVLADLRRVQQTFRLVSANLRAGQGFPSDFDSASAASWRVQVGYMAVHHACKRSHTLL